MTPLKLNNLTNYDTRETLVQNSDRSRLSSPKAHLPWLPSIARQNSAPCARNWSRASFYDKCTTRGIHRHNLEKGRATSNLTRPYRAMTSTLPDGSIQVEDMSAINTTAADNDVSHPLSGEEDLSQLVYLSSASAAYSKQDLIEILAISRRNNTAANITGLLLYHDGNIIQFLEGDTKDVQRLYNRIAGDNRHKGVLPLLTRKIKSRDFASWSMGFKSITDEEKEELDGFNDLMNSLSSHTVADPSMSKPVQRLIRSYRQVSVVNGPLDWSLMPAVVGFWKGIRRRPFCTCSTDRSADHALLMPVYIMTFYL